MRVLQTVTISALAIILGTGLTGCAKEKGPAEEAGSSLDDALGSAQEGMEDAAKEAEKAVEDAKE